EPLWLPARRSAGASAGAAAAPQPPPPSGAWALRARAALCAAGDHRSVRPGRAAPGALARPASPTAPPAQPFLPQEAAHRAARHRDPALVGGGRERIERPVRLSRWARCGQFPGPGSGRLAGGWQLDQREEPAALDRREPWLAASTGWYPEALAPPLG